MTAPRNTVLLPRNVALLCCRPVLFPILEGESRMDDWYTAKHIWMGTLLGLCYAIPAGVAFLSWDDSRHCEFDTKDVRRLWLATAGILACLTVAMWLQAPHILETWGRETLVQAGVWGNRRPMQAAVIGLIVLATSAVCGGVLLRSTAAWSARLLFVGAVAAISDAIIRAVSFHYVDLMMGYHLVSVIYVGTLIRGAGIGWMWAWAIAAFRELMERKNRPMRRHRR